MLTRHRVKFRIERSGGPTEDRLRFHGVIQTFVTHGSAVVAMERDRWWFANRFRYRIVRVDVFEVTEVLDV